MNLTLNQADLQYGHLKLVLKFPNRAVCAGRRIANQQLHGHMKDVPLPLHLPSSPRSMLSSNLCRTWRAAPVCSPEAVMSGTLQLNTACLCCHQPHYSCYFH